MKLPNPKSKRKTMYTCMFPPSSIAVCFVDCRYVGEGCGRDLGVVGLFVGWYSRYKV